MDPWAANHDQGGTMAQGGGVDRDERAHELYWNSDRSVNSIVEELGLSKGRLYQSVQPIPAGTRCAICGATHVFENRTARDRDEPICPECGAKAAEPGTGRKESSATAHPGTAARPAPSPGRRLSIPEGLSPDARQLAAGLVLGAAAGILLVSLIRR